jgi:demethylmenaquinone methyltransferase/2-methoxy-6-polyprenyl-1,4-benzoquinol methylase
MSVTPYQNKSTGKKEQVAEMFNNIAHKYDFLNHFLSLGIDILWRKKAVKQIEKDQPKHILDIATGTGDFAIECLKLNPTKITGVDISEGMLDMGRIKMKERNYDKVITLEYGDSENLPFESNSFDAITVGFGVRNFENLEKGLSEMRRVLKENGNAVVLEFSQPETFPIKQIYNFYFKKILPFVGNKLSKDSAAYTYLPASVDAFPYGEKFMDILQKVGFKKVKTISLFFGIASIYHVKK